MLSVLFRVFIFIKYTFRNLAALKCRQRKKQWLTNLQERVEYLTNDNEQLQLQASLMRNEVLNLRSLLMAHKECSNGLQQSQMYNNS